MSPEPSTAPATQPPATLSDLRAALPKADLPLRVLLPDGPMGAAFHLTEVKRQRVTSLDCGRGSHAWSEVVVQLLDGDIGTALSTHKLRGILDAAMGDALAGDLFFEGARGNIGLEKFQLADVVVTETDVVLEMRAMSATCKPSQLFERPGGADAGCCAPGATTSCCGTGAAVASACC